MDRRKFLKFLGIAGVATVAGKNIATGGALPIVKDKPIESKAIPEVHQPAVQPPIIRQNVSALTSCCFDIDLFSTTRRDQILK